MEKEALGKIGFAKASSFKDPTAAGESCQTAVRVVPNSSVEILPTLMIREGSD